MVSYVVYDGDVMVVLVVAPCLIHFPTFPCILQFVVFLHNIQYKQYHYYIIQCLFILYSYNNSFKSDCRNIFVRIRYELWKDYRKIQRRSFQSRNNKFASKNLLNFKSNDLTWNCIQEFQAHYFYSCIVFTRSFTQSKNKSYTCYKYLIRFILPFSIL